MKSLTAVALLLCALAVPRGAAAQEERPWVELSNPGEYFRVSMPHKPKEDSFDRLTTNFGELKASGKSYMASIDGAIYILWTIANASDRAHQKSDLDSYLDYSAEVVWEGLLKPARDKLPKDDRNKAAMSYMKELTPQSLPGREYSLVIGNLVGTAQFYAAESRMYALVAMGPAGGGWSSEKFFASFQISPNVLRQLQVVEQPKGGGVGGGVGSGVGGGVGPGVGGGVRGTSNAVSDSNRIFRSADVTQRARVLEKPEPVYTESARKFSITGTVVLRCVFSKNGEVTNIVVVRKLPHGLTSRALDAARRIRFIPAEKDGHPVSMWMQLEYNFNLY
jgi:TonB family protein